MAAPTADAYQSGVSIWDGVGGANSDTNYSTHHIWIINNIIHGYGQSGIQINDGEYFYVMHNTTYGNSTGTCDARGSGISMGFLKQTPGGLSPPADDPVNPNAYIGTLTPFRNVVSWNISYNNNVNGCNQSDGNGLIMDRFDIGGTMYPFRSLVAFNIVYNNGGSGLDVFECLGEQQWR
jgi:serralysin